MTLMISIGKWGGFYPHFGKSTCRICLGFIAFTIVWFDLDMVLEDMATAWLEKRKKVGRKRPWKVPPFKFDAYYGADGIPVVHIDTPSGWDNNVGPRCRVYLNDGEIYENPPLNRKRKESISEDVGRTNITKKIDNQPGWLLRLWQKLKQKVK